MKLTIPSPHVLWIRFVCSLGLIILDLHDFKSAIIFSLIYTLIYSIFNYMYLYFVVQYASRNLVLYVFGQKLSGIIIFYLLYRNFLLGLVLEFIQIMMSYLNPQKGEGNRA